jgi:hypothetical protein
MSATITSMDYRLVDTLNADQLEVDDLIGLGDEVIKVLSILPAKTGFVIEYANEFGEKDFLEILDEDKFSLYILE